MEEHLADDEQGHERCTECRRMWDGLERGWRRYLTVAGVTALYCPDCAEREFGSD